MRVNLPVSQQQYPMADGTMLVSTTDVQGRITHCNRAFTEVSGYTYEELIQQPHNLIRHPDMPDRKSTRLNSSHIPLSRMPSSA